MSLQSLLLALKEILYEDNVTEVTSTRCCFCYSS